MSESPKVQRAGRFLAERHYYRSTGAYSLFVSVLCAISWMKMGR